MERWSGYGDSWGNGLLKHWSAGDRCMDEHTENYPQDLQRAGEAVGRLPRPAPPQGLAARTLARIESSQAAESSALQATTAATSSPATLLQRSYWRRRLTSPLARAAAAAALLATLGLLSSAVRNLDTAERLGRSIETVIGAHATDRLERWTELLLLSYGRVRVNDTDIERLIGEPGIPFSPSQTLMAQPKKEEPATPGVRGPDRRAPLDGRPLESLCLSAPPQNISPRRHGDTKEFRCES